MPKQKPRFKPVKVPDIRYLLRVSVAEQTRKPISKHSCKHSKDRSGATVSTSRIPHDKKTGKSTILRTYTKVFKTPEAITKYAEKHIDTFTSKKKGHSISASVQKFSGKVSKLGMVKGGVSKAVRVKAVKQSDKFRKKKFMDALQATDGALEQLQEQPFQIYTAWHKKSKYAPKTVTRMKRAMRFKERQQLEESEE